MKLLLVSEGKHELGGSLESLIRRLSERKLEVRHAKVSEPDIHTHRGKGQGFFKRAIRWLLEARKRGYDAVVLVVDEDGYAERASELATAQEYSAMDFPRAFGIAIRTFDAWMLADEAALTTVLGYHIQRQAKPEELARPKQICQHLLDTSGGSLSQTEMYARLAEVLDLALLEERCPRGFAPFAQRVRQLGPTQ